MEIVSKKEIEERDIKIDYKLGNANFILDNITRALLFSGTFSRVEIYALVTELVRVKECIENQISELLNKTE